jgi:copper chaperone CopZ
MEKKRFEAPALYADHHVSEVRRILLELAGVTEVYASSAFRLIEVEFDPSQVSGKQIEAQLREAGYLDEMPVPSEPGTAVARSNGNGAFRHTAVYQGLQGTVSFAQTVQSGGRPLWPCPGMDREK